MSSQIEVLNPATGLAIGTVDNASIADCLHAVDICTVEEHRATRARRDTAQGI